MLHICFDDSAYGSIRHAMKLGLIKEENVISFNDDLSVGDISNCQAYEHRKAVIHNIYNDEMNNIADDELKKKFDGFYKRLSKENAFIIWYANNPKDYCNLYYVVSLLLSQNIQVVECDKKTLNDRTFTYKWVGEVCMEDLPMLLKERKKLSEQEKMIYAKKWEQLVYENGLLRVETPIVGEFIGMQKPCLRDWFVVWRIKL